MACNGLHKYFLKQYYGHRIVSEFLIGFMMGNIPSLSNKENRHLDVTLGFIAQVGMLGYVFVLGLEMEPSKLIFQVPAQEYMVSCMSIVSQALLGFMVSRYTDLLQDTQLLEVGHLQPPSPAQMMALSITMAGTSSPVLTRLITNLKIGNSDIGKFVVAAASQSDFLCTAVFCIISIFDKKDKAVILAKVAFLSIQIAITSQIGPVILNWVNSENPEGKDMKGPHLVLFLAFVCLLCVMTTSVGYSPLMSVFITGLCLPRHGRMSRMMIGRVNYMMMHIFYPVFFIWLGLLTNYKRFEPHRRLWSLFQLLFLCVLGPAGKVMGAVISGLFLGIHWQDSASIGLLLALKGYFHLYIIGTSIADKHMFVSTGLMIILSCVFTLLYSPFVIKSIISRAKKQAPNQNMALQFLDPSAQLKLMLCIIKPQNVAAAINLMHISRGLAQQDIGVYLIDMVESTGDTRVEEGVVRDTIAKEVTACRIDDRIDIKNKMVVSTLNTMPNDICELAENLGVSLIVLPFHRVQMPDGKLDETHSGYYLVNKKILKNAPCSVGILVDRGLGMIEQISTSSVVVKAAVIFIGGRDDREALIYSSRVAQNPGVSLTVIRFLVDTSMDDIASVRAGKRVNVQQKEEEMRQDDESFANFYEKHIARGGRVSYVEKYLVNSAETLSTLQALARQYELIIVGKGGGLNSVLTIGMRDWEQCPELGPIGDILSSTHFSQAGSVLIIQQHDQKGGIAGLDDDFSIMG
uniref:Cation/H+ exchanger domain-containing protein n=1 Tax=Kalanchoe fedtschenkoi TaxID=63787 RepID=A0A7N0UR47_KALFE